MSEGIRRLILVVIALLGGLLVMLAIGKFVPGYSLYHFFKGHSMPNENRVHLAEKPVVNRNEVTSSIQLSRENAIITSAVMPSIVSINTSGTSLKKKTTTDGSIYVPRGVVANGSGVIVSKEGHIITNHHVIANKQNILITLSNGAKREAILLGYDPALDIAVLKIAYPRELPALRFGDSDSVKEGHIAMAFGNPYGFGRSVTNGIISARKSSRSDKQVSLFQTNVAINPGNSGGPLVNVLGDIIGINTSIYSSDKENPAFQGISFAVPSNLVKKTFLDILKFKRPMRGYLGLFAEDLSESSLKNEVEYPREGGVIVREVEKGAPAHLAGLQAKDVIIEYAGNQIDDSLDLMKQIHASEVGKDLMITVWRKGAEREITVRLAEIDYGAAYLKQRQHSKEVNQAILRIVGISGKSLSPDYGINGVEITAVLAQSLSGDKLRKGDIIYQINNNPIYHAAQLKQLILVLAPAGETQFHVIRNGEKLESTIILPKVEL